MNQEKKPPFDGALTTEEVMAITGRSKNAVQHAYRVGALPRTKKIGGVTGRLWFHIEDVRECFPPERRAAGRLRPWKWTRTDEEAVAAHDEFTAGVDQAEAEAEREASS